METLKAKVSLCLGLLGCLERPDLRPTKTEKRALVDNRTQRRKKKRNTKEQIETRQKKENPQAFQMNWSILNDPRNLLNI